MNKRAVLIATMKKPPSAGGNELSDLPVTVQWLEVRADVIGDLKAEWLRHHFRGRLLYSLRSRAEGGEGMDGSWERGVRLVRAAQRFDLVELEGERDLLPEVLGAIPPEKRLISWHGPATDAAGLRDRFNRISAVTARLYRLVPRADHPCDGLAPLAFLHALGRADTISYAAGETGFWSRVISPHLGAPVVFGTVHETPDIEVNPTIAQLLEDYGFPYLQRPETLYGIVGKPVLQSLSPRLHNAAHRGMRSPALYVPFHAESFAEFWAQVVERESFEMMGMPLMGLTVASPYKEAALEVAGMRSPRVQRAGSCNVFVRQDNGWRADTTDPEGVLLNLHDCRIPLKGRQVAVIGCGGAGRAVAAALDEAGAQVTLVNRGLLRGQFASKLLNLPVLSLSEFSARSFDIVVHATPVGRDDKVLPFSVEQLCKNAVVVDLVYGAESTPLVARTRGSGLLAVTGCDVLRTQVRQQFRLMTGEEMPLEAVRGELGSDKQTTEKLTVSL